MPFASLRSLAVLTSRPHGRSFALFAAKLVDADALKHLVHKLRKNGNTGSSPGDEWTMSLDAFEAEAQRAPSEVDLHGKPVVPVTYASCVFLSPLAPELRVSVNMALVDSGSSDCELREGFLDRLGRLPTVAEGVVYETVAGRHVFDSYEVLVAIGGRVCACAVTGVPEERFHPGAEDPASDEAVIGLAALSALDLVVTCGQRTVVSARP